MRLVRTVVVLAACKGAPAQEPHAHEHPHHHDFHDAEQWATRFDAKDRDAWQKPADVIALMQLAPTDRVADLGAGTGYFEPHLARAVPQGKVLALDSEPAMVEYMTKRMTREGIANVEARVVKPGDPDLAAASVDKILVVDTWHHLDDRAAYAGKLATALSPCGALVVVDFTAESPIGPPVAMRIAPDALVRELAAAGLAARIAEETLPHQYVVVGVREAPGCAHPH